MPWFQISIIANVVLLVILAFLALDRKNWNSRLEEFKNTTEKTIQGFKETCALRHNPIDEAIKRIDENITRIWDRIDKLG